MEKVSLVSLEGIVEVMVKATLADFGTMIASTDRAVTKGTVLFEIGGAIFGAVFARFGALFKVGTDYRGIKAVARLKVSVLLISLEIVVGSLEMGRAIAVLESLFSDGHPG